jgi:glutathione S-transferase
MTLTIIGRSSSHFTRTARLFAHELSVEHAFRPVADLTSRDVSHYAGNPSLKIPILETAEGPWFGALNICRELARRAAHVPVIGWPELLTDRIAVNAQELVLQGMSTEVSLIMQAAAQPNGVIARESKAMESLLNSLQWLDAHLPEVRARQAAPGALSILDITAYCFFTHLEFREVTDVRPYRALRAFCDAYGARPAAQATSYRFDF